MKKSFIIMLSDCNQPVFRTNEILDVFDTSQAAQTAIDEHLKDEILEVEAGNIEAETASTSEDYYIQEVTVLNPEAPISIQKIVLSTRWKWYNMERQDEDFTVGGYEVTVL